MMSGIHIIDLSDNTCPECGPGGPNPHLNLKDYTINPPCSLCAEKAKDMIREVGRKAAMRRNQAAFDLLNIPTGDGI